MTEKGLDLNDNGTLKYAGSIYEDAQFPDRFTKAGVGGEHSNYKPRGVDNQGRVLMEFIDEQKLNP